jgi:hypothetical protein
MGDVLFPVENEIYDELNARAKELYDRKAPEREWTAEYKQALLRLGNRHGFQAWASGLPDGGEWLWDVCWVRCDRKEWWKSFRGVFLACEIEWNAAEEKLMEDFLKLTVAVADFRLFVCTLHPEKRERTFDPLLAGCPGSRGARYLAIGVPIPGKCSPDDPLPYRAWTL